MTALDEAPARPRVKATERVRRLAGAANALQTHRDRLAELQDGAEALQTSDVVVVLGELEVIRALESLVTHARQLLAQLVDEPGDTDALVELEQIVAPPRWSALDTVATQLDRKRSILEAATIEIGARVGEWKEIVTKVEDVNAELKQRRAVLSREVKQGRGSLLSLYTQLEKEFEAKGLLKAAMLLDRLDHDPPPPTTPDAPSIARATDILGLLTKELESWLELSGRVQLTVLRGLLDSGRYDYTVMLVAPGSEGFVAINVQDTSTIVKQDREYFLEVMHRTGNSAYRSLRAAVTRDAGEEAAAADPSEQPHDGVQQLRDMGAVLYKLLLPDRMKEELLRHPHAQLTITTNDLELPWELMHDGDDDRGTGVVGEFLSLQRPVARMPVGRSRRRHSPRLEGSATTRRIALIASFGHPPLLDAKREVDQIGEQMKKEWKDRVEIDVLETKGERGPDGGNFRDVLLSQKYDIVHFAGHAAYDASRPDQSGLLLDGPELCFAQKIQRLLAGHPLVFLNACETARLESPDAAPPPEGMYESDPSEGLASAFVYGGALACVGTAWRVTDNVAADFAVKFYSQVIEGQPLGQAVLEARTHTAKLHPQDTSWAAFVLYGDPSFQMSPLLDTRRA